MPTSALTRSLATLAIVVALLGATLAAPTAQAADRGDRGDRKAGAQTSQRTVLAKGALTRAQDALAGKGGDATMALRDLSMLKGALSPADRAAADRLADRPVKASSIAAGNIRVHYTASDFALSTFTPTDVLNTSVAVSQVYSAAGYRKPKPDFGKGGGQPDRHLRRQSPTRPLRLLHDRQQHQAARPGPLRRPGLLRGRHRLHRLPAAHPDREPPGDSGARVLPRHPVRLRLLRGRLVDGGHGGLGRGRGVRRGQRQRPVPRRQPDHPAASARWTSSAASTTTASGSSSGT